MPIVLCDASNSSPTTGSSSFKRIVDADSPLTDSEHSKFRTAVGKLLWLAFVRPDCSHAATELSRDVKGPTLESLAKLKHLLRYLFGSKLSVLRETLADIVCLEVLDAARPESLLRVALFKFLIVTFTVLEHRPQ